MQQKNGDTPQGSGEWLERGRQLYEAANWQGAQEAFEHAREVDAIPVECSHWLGLCYVELGLVQDAIEVWEEAAVEGHLPSRLQLGLLLARQARQTVRKRAIAHLEAVLEGGSDDFDGLDRLCFTLGSLYAEKGDESERAVRLFRRGLALDPLSASGHNSLGQLLMQEGQVLGAMGEFKVSIQLDAAQHAPYINLARLFLRHVKPDELELEYRHITDEFEEKAPQVLARLSLEMVDAGKQQVYEGFYTKGHRLKNLMGLMGSRLRKLAQKSEREASELGQLEGEHERLYDEWVSFLGAMKTEVVRPMRVEVERLVKRVVEVARSQEWKSQLQMRVQEEVPAIEADERMLREAVLNLCLNALEVLEERGGGHVVLGVGHDVARERVYVEVEDDGPGIAEEHIDLVFEPGFTMRERGNGYGLSIARRIVRAHHGELRVVSRRGHGTVFRIDLPLSFSDGDS